MSLRVSLLNGCNNNYDYDLGMILYALAQTHGVISGLAVTTGEVSAGVGFIFVTRTGGYTFPVLIRNTATYVLDTTGTKKVWIELDQADIDDNGININAAQDNVVSIQTGASYPVTAHLKLASIAGGVITDEREAIQSTQAVNRLGSLAETVTGIKTFSSFPITPSSPPSTNYQVANKKYVDDTVAAAGTNVVGLTEETAPTGDDFGLIYENTAGANRKSALTAMVAAGLKITTGNGTRTTGDSTGSQTIAHGLGKVPKIVNLAFVKSQDAGSNAICGRGVANGSVNYCIGLVDIGASATPDMDTGKCMRYEDSISVGRSATITLDATNITVSWTKGGAGIDLDWIWEAIG